MEVQGVIDSLQPFEGEVVPIKTVQETQAPEEFGDAYVAEVNIKSASKVIKVLDSNFPRDTSQPFNHLRRFSKRDQLPEPIRPSILGNDPSQQSQSIFVLITPPLPDKEKLQTLLAPFAPPTENSQDAIRFHTIRIPLQPPLNSKQAERWSKTLWPVVFNPAAPRATIAPPPQILNRTRESVQMRAGYYLALARKVSEEAKRSGFGREVGAVVVDPAIETDGEKNGWEQAVVAVAGDSRYSRREAGALSQSELHLGSGPNPASQTYNSDLEGGPELHALMRAVDMVARKRRAEHELDDPTTSLSSPIDKPYISALESYFLSQSDISSPSLTDPEDPNPDTDPPEKYQKLTETTAVPVSKDGEENSTAPRIRSRTQGGYLCSDLDVYLTHEPCVCCSMGMLLSRFRAVIFPRGGRMVTGGLASEPVVCPTADEEGEEKEEETGRKDKSIDPVTNRKYYGLHWRKELNWRALGFEFVDGTVEDGIEGVAFHA